VTEERRKRSTGRDGRRRPGAPPRGRASERKPAARPRPEPAEERHQEERGRSRFTGRMAVLVLVLAVLAVSYASSLRAYLQQRTHIESLEQEIAQTTAEIEALEKEEERWQDPSYVAQQARMLGYVEPGETPFVVLDENGDPLGGVELPDPSEVPDDQQPAWYDVLWRSAGVAGDPPTTVPPPPATQIEDDAATSDGRGR
jgi:cell division protein FtsB